MVADVTDASKLQTAAAAFLSAMRREHAKVYGNANSPIRELENYPIPQRNALLRALAVAIQVYNTERQGES